MDADADKGESQPSSPRKLPPDLPRTLDDRRSTPMMAAETEIYDAWQGQSQFLTTPMPSQPLKFNLSLTDAGYDDVDNNAGDIGLPSGEESDGRLVQMLASQARLRGGSLEVGEDAILADAKLSESEKGQALQSILTMAASNGEVDRVKRLLSGATKGYVDVNCPDAEGTPPIIYASCFGHQDVVSALIDAGAEVDKQDKNSWSALMWAMTNRHKGIAKILLDHGASPDIKSSSGRSAFDFVAPNSEMFDYLNESGYKIGNAGVTDDFYNAGFSQDRFEEEMAENEMKRRMMMESAMNLEVDLGNLGLDEQPESPDEIEDGQEFVWDRCLNDQMFVFQEADLGRILDIIITNMTPQRSPSQKPVPANILFLGARYAHYHASPELLETLLWSAMDKINDVVDTHQWDMTILAFWISNATLLLHYLKKDSGLAEATSRFQLHLAELINEIFILIIRDAERRMDKVFDKALLDHETIPGLEDITFQNEWKIFRSKPKPKPQEPLEKRFRPPSPKRRAQTSPRNITSLLSSTLFVLELYDIHSVITGQILAQLLYWLGAELFNRILSNRKYLARTKAMQIRMNVSILEDWARVNNRQPEHYENGSTTSTGENTAEAARRHLAPAVQLLQWLQCFSSLGEDFEALIGTLQQLPRLTPQQLIHSVKYYRVEVGEKSLPKNGMKYLQALQQEHAERRAKLKAAPLQNLRPTISSSSPSSSTTTKTTTTPAAAAAAAAATTTTTTVEKPPVVSTPTKSNDSKPVPHLSPTSPLPPEAPVEEQEVPENLLMDPAVMLPFSLPTSTDMLVSYGAGFGGMNRERERKYIPTVPPEFLIKLDNSGSKSNSVYDSRSWEE